MNANFSAKQTATSAQDFPAADGPLVSSQVWSVRGAEPGNKTTYGEWLQRGMAADKSTYYLSQKLVTKKL